MTERSRCILSGMIIHENLKFRLTWEGSTDLLSHLKTNVSANKDLVRSNRQENCNSILTQDYWAFGSTILTWSAPCLDGGESFSHQLISILLPNETISPT